ncbi:MAG: methyltransferase [Pseudomonadota bacterium]
MLQPERTTTDTLLGGRVQLEQPETGYRAAIDSVFLAAAVPIESGETALELGLGVGSASLCLLARVPGITVQGIEHDARMAELAQRNAALNGVIEKLAVICGDITARLEHAPFDHVFCNPPFHDTAAHGEGASSSHMPAEHIRLWIRTAARNLKPRGQLTLIHRADALANILNALGDEFFGAIRIMPVSSYANESAKRVLVSAVKDRKTPLELLPPLIVHNDQGGYTDRSENILRQAAPLPMKG